MKDIINLCLFLLICGIIYLVFRNFNYKEGMTTDKTADSSSGVTGIAGEAAAYGATIKSTSIKLQDTILISKYRDDYETAILNLDDLVNNLMLQTSLSIDPENPVISFKRLAEMQQVKTALNSVMKFVDAT